MLLGRINRPKEKLKLQFQLRLGQQLNFDIAKAIISKLQKKKIEGI